MSPSHSRAAAPELRLSAQPESRRSWLRELWAHRVVLGMLARADFQARYKRTSFGVAWAVVVPMIQAVVIVVVFSRLIKLPTTRDFGAYVLGGTLSWNYFSSSVGASSSAIVDGAGLTDKVWFPRALLSGIAPLSNLPGLVAAVILLAVALPFLGSSISFNLLLLPVAIIALVVITTAFGFLLSALHVYFRDVKFLVQAALVPWFYLTPIVYPKQLLGKLQLLIDLNPLTGVVTLFRLASVGAADWVRPVAVTAVVTVVLVVVGAEVQRRHDRLFVDLL